MSDRSATVDVKASDLKKGMFTPSVGEVLFVVGNGSTRRIIISTSGNHIEAKKDDLFPVLEYSIEKEGK